MEILRKLGGLDMVHVPYKGGAGPANAGLMGGETQLIFSTAASAMPGFKGGRVRLLAVTSAKRMEQVPEAPTVTEEGYPDVTASSWQGLFVPTGTERAIVERLFAVAQQVMAAPGGIARLKTSGGGSITSPASAGFSKCAAERTPPWGRFPRGRNAPAAASRVAG